MYNIYQSLKNTATNHPEHVAIFDEFGELTYAQLFAKTESLRLALENLGIEKGQAIGVITGNNRHFLICLYAAVATGALAMPIFHQQKDAEILAAINDAQLHAILADNQSQITLANNTVVPIHSTYYLARTHRDTKNSTANFIENPAFMRFTSGTTGAAKGVILSHQNVLERINAANAFLKITPKDKVLWVFPMAFHFVVSIILYVKNGATIICQNDFLAQSILGRIKEHGATFLYCSPMHIKLLAAYKNAQPQPSLRTVISTTTGASAADCLAFKKAYNIPVQQAFGIIEVGLPIINSNSAKENPGAVGHAIPGFEVAILDDDFNEKPPLKIGHLALRGPGMFSGYLSPPQPLHTVLKNGWFLTGDLAQKSEDGLITIMGRTKNVIIVHGNKVFPFEIEYVLNTFPGVKMSKAFSQKHALFGEVVAAEIVVEHAIDTKLVQRHCKKMLSAYKVPQEIVVVNSIEMTASGKIKRS